MALTWWLFAALCIAASVLFVAGICILAGAGWALLAGALVCAAAAAFLRHCLTEAPGG